MTALSIPCTSHEQALAVIQHGWAVVDGLCLHCGPRVSWHHKLDCGNEPASPPAEWLKALEPCLTCEWSEWCDNCHGAGKPRIEVTEPCGRCEDEPSYCDYCGGFPAHVGWVTVTEVLPVLPPDDEIMPGTGAFTSVIGDQVWLYPTTGSITDITADVAHLGNPGDLVGRWLLKVEVVA